MTAGVAIFGGTFDPIHIGHLRSALEVRELLDGVDVRLLPSNIPPHRDAPGATPQQRLKMLELAIEGVQGLQIDTRELDRKGRSYMYDTLSDIRSELGPDIPIYLVLGEDAFNLLHEWHNWQALTDVAHILVLGRPGDKKQPEQTVQNWSADKWVQALASLSSSACGGIAKVNLSQLDISATKIRALCGAGAAIDYLVPKSVAAFIKQEELYRAKCA